MPAGDAIDESTGTFHQRSALWFHGLLLSFAKLDPRRSGYTFGRWHYGRRTPSFLSRNVFKKDIALECGARDSTQLLLSTVHTHRPRMPFLVSQLGDNASFHPEVLHFSISRLDVVVVRHNIHINIEDLHSASKDTNFWKNLSCIRYCSWHLRKALLLSLERAEIGHTAYLFVVLRKWDPANSLNFTGPLSKSIALLRCFDQIQTASTNHNCSYRRCFDLIQTA